jgi:hypothetical protein
MAAVCKVYYSGTLIKYKSGRIIHFNKNDAACLYNKTYLSFLLNGYLHSMHFIIIEYR